MKLTRMVRQTGYLWICLNSNSTPRITLKAVSYTHLASKGHALILPKNHFKDVCGLDQETAGKVLTLGAKIGTAMKKSLGCTGFNLVQNNGESAGQTVFHFHMHVIPRYEGGPAMVGWTPGKADPDELAATAEQIKGAL